MDFELDASEKIFRDEVRAWLKANAPKNDSTESDQGTLIANRRAWQKKLNDAGYVGITWPKEYGGRGAGFMEQLIFNDEMIVAQTPEPINVIGLGMGFAKKNFLQLDGYVGVVFNRELVPGTLKTGQAATQNQLESDLRSRRVRKLAIGINLPVGQFLKALKSK